MNLSQMYALANSKSGYSRPEPEIYAALGRAGFRVYAAVLKEFRGFFLKFDETTLILTPGKFEYTLPDDLTQIVHLSERLGPSDNWRPMAPLDMDTVLNNVQQASGWSDFYSNTYGYDSSFGFYGPYLDSQSTAVPQAVQTQKIRVSPALDQMRACQIVYTAKWLPITDGSSKVMLPDEGTYPMESFASAECCANSDDQSKAAGYEALGKTDLTAFLSWLRNRQIMQAPTIRTYGP